MTLQEPQNPPIADVDTPDTEVIVVAHPSPVFVDSTGRRRRMLRRVAYGFGALCMLYGGLVSVSLAGGPVSSSAVLPLPDLADGSDEGDVVVARPTPTPKPAATQPILEVLPRQAPATRPQEARGVTPRSTVPGSRPARTRTAKPTKKPSSPSTAKPVESAVTDPPNSSSPLPSTSGSPTPQTPLPPGGGQTGGGQGGGTEGGDGQADGGQTGGGQGGGGQGGGGADESPSDGGQSSGDQGGGGQSSGGSSAGGSETRAPVEPRPPAATTEPTREREPEPAGEPEPEPAGEPEPEPTAGDTP